MTERRKDPRIPYRIKAFMGEIGEGRLFETTDVSAGGVYFTNDPGVGVGSTVLMRLEYSTTKGSKEYVFPLLAEVEVVRLSRIDNTVLGFGARWISIASRGEVTPLFEFLRETLTIRKGFVQAMKPEGADVPSIYVFDFPRLNTSTQGQGKVLDTEITPVPKDEEPYKRAGTGLYVVLPIIFVTDAGEFEGTALKLMDRGIRVSTRANLPEPYKKITIRIPAKVKDRSSLMNLFATVTAVRKPASETGEGQFEAEFILSNDPKIMEEYRLYLDHLQEKASSLT